MCLVLPTCVALEAVPGGLQGAVITGSSRHWEGHPPDVSFLLLSGPSQHGFPGWVLPVASPGSHSHGHTSVVGLFSEIQLEGFSFSLKT